ncbi:MAG: tyrosine-type recombinase/integrase [Anaerolineales bacterium]
MSKGRLTILKTARLDEDIRGFLVDREARGLSPRTVRFYADELANLAAFLQSRGIHDTLDITASDLRGFLLALGERRNPGGVHAAYRAVRAFLRWYASEYEPEGWRNPIAKVAPPKVPDKTLDPVPLADVRAMLDTCERRTFTGDRDRAILLCLLDTGARASEFCALDTEDVDIRTGAVRIRHGKGGKSRTVFLGAKARRALTEYLRHRETGGPLWITERGERLRFGGLVAVLRRRAEIAGVPAPRPHAFRRAFALLSLRGGCDLMSLQKLMGHADLSVLRRYLKQTEADLQEAHRRAAPVDRYL